MSVGIAQRVQGAYNAGFRNTAAIESLSIIVAISLAECGIGSGSGCETGCNPDSGALSCGMLQIFQPAHPGTAACASDPSCVWTLGWAISNHGTSFGAWSTYNSGAFRQYLQSVRNTIAGMAAPIGPQPTPTPTPAPTPTPTPTPPPTPVPPSGGSTLGWLLLIGGGAGLGYLGWKRHKGGQEVLPGYLRSREPAFRP